MSLIIYKFKINFVNVSLWLPFKQLEIMNDASNVIINPALTMTLIFLLSGNYISTSLRSVVLTILTSVGQENRKVFATVILSKF